MSDVMDCPECRGSRRDPHVPPVLNLACQFCSGLGYVGGDNEPAEPPERPEVEDEGSINWEGQQAPPLAGCTTCAGQGEVLSLGGRVRGGQARGGAMVPCPDCRPRAASA